jgi:uncharacterized protein YbjT (DUF2867 family)
VRLLILGGTGATGKAVVSLVLANPLISEVIAPSRRPLSPHVKLRNPVFKDDLLSIPDEFWKVDSVICALGTTIKKAGSRAAFTSIDYDLPIAAARKAHAAGADVFALVSSVGASSPVNFYLQTKANLEDAIATIGYGSFTIVRPSLIAANREELRVGEAIGRALARFIDPFLPLQYRSVTPEQIAEALVSAVLKKPPGRHVIESAALQVRL